MTLTLRQHLESLNGDVLRGLLKKLGIPQTGLTRKEQFADALERQLGDGMERVLATLGSQERIWLADSAHQERFVGEAEFVAKFGGSWPWRSSDDSWSYRRDPSALDAMVHRDWQKGEAFILPGLIKRLQAALPKPTEAPIRTIAQLPLDAHKHEGSDCKPLRIFEGERIGPAELARILRLAQAGTLKITDSTRRPTDAATRLIGESLITPDFELEPPPGYRNSWAKEEPAGPVRAHAWGVLVQQCGWAKPKGSTLALTPAGRELLQGFDADQYRAGVRRFMTNGDFDELNRINHLRGQTGKGKRWLTNPAVRKSAVSEVLAKWPVGEWIEFREAHRTINASGANWNVMERTGCLYLCEAQYGTIYDGGGVNSQFLRTLLMESMATLGLVDIGYVCPHGEWPDLHDNWGADAHYFLGRYDGLRYVRLTPLGSFCLGASESYCLQAGKRASLFRVLPNHEIVLTQGGTDPANRAMLELMAAPRTELVWVLDAERVLTHVETGGSLTELRQFLETHAAEGLPENVQIFLRGFESKLGACRSACKAVLLDWQDEATARLVASSAGLRKLCSHAGDNRLVVAESDYRAFSRMVKKLGFVVPPRPA